MFLAKILILFLIELWTKLRIIVYVQILIAFYLFFILFFLVSFAGSANLQFLAIIVTFLEDDLILVFKKKNYKLVFRKFCKIISFI
jgi:hypothetical protein